MIYFDYTANTPASKDVIKAFIDAEQKYIGNANSKHPAGKQANERIQEASNKIANLLNIKPNEIVYTSGATEANNLAIKGLVHANKHKGKHIISSFLEHSSISASLSSLQEEGYEIDLCPIDRNGKIDLEELSYLLRKDTVLVAISAVDSELGIIQPVKEVYELIKKQSDSYLHVDITQAIGKIPVDFNCGDSFSLAGHKIYGLNGIGAYIKRNGITPIPQISGGNSTTIFRSGSPCTSLIVSLEVALENILKNQKENNLKVLHLNQKLRSELMEIPEIQFNSSGYAIPYILNLGIKGIYGNYIQEKLAQKDICVSVKSACSSDLLPSKPVYAITKDKKRARESFRISLSPLTTENEIEILVKAIKEIVEGETL